MDKENQILHNAINELRNQTGKDIKFLHDEHTESRSDFDAAVLIDNIKFLVDIKTELRASNKGLILPRIEKLKNTEKLPVLLIANYIAGEIQEELKSKTINYLDSKGNAFINAPGIYVYISGRKPEKLKKSEESVLFQEAGIKLIFSLLSEPHSETRPYRTLAEMSGISIGWISKIMNELEESNFLLQTGTGRKLKNLPNLLERWVVAYSEVLKPRILLKRMRFASPEKYRNWSQITLPSTKNINLWGAEPAAALTTGYLNPEVFTIYTSGVWQDIASELKLIPDENGNVEIRQIFWNEDCFAKRDKNVTPPLLTYADLIESADDRAIETANIILNNELHYIR